MARTVSVKLMADVSQFAREVGGRAVGSVKTLGGEIDKANKAGKLDAVTHSAAGLGLSLLGVAGAAVKFAADFDKQMSAVRAATHGSTAEIESLRKASIQAGKDTQFSATAAADGVTQLAKAGVSTADILGGGLKGALDLAAAGQMDVGDAAEVSASALTQFNLKGAQLPHVADLLAAGAGKAQGSVQDMSAALNQSGLIAAQTGLSIEDTTGTLAAFASAGLMGSDAGTSFKTMLQALQAPSGKTADLMKDLGISAYDASGNFVGITNLAEQLRTKLGSLTQAQRDNAMAQIFGSDATRAANVLYKQGAAGIQEWINKTNDAGYAAETAAIQTDNLAGDIERLKGSLETMAIESGSGANSGLRVLAKSVNGLVNEFGQLPPAIGGAVTVIAGITGVTLLAGSGWLIMRRRTAEALEELAKTGPMGEKAAAGLGKVQGAVGKVAIAFAALEAAGAIVHHFQDQLNPQIDAMATGLEKYASTGKLAGEASRVLGGDLGDLEHGFKFLADGDNARRNAVRNLQQGLEALPIGLDGANQSLTKTAERVTAVDSALAQLVQSGQTQQASTAFNKLAAQLAVGGVSMEEFRKQFPQYAAAVEVSNGASNTAKTSIAGVGAAADDTANKIKELDARFNGLFDSQMSIDRANIKFQQGLVAVEKELKSGTRTLALNKEEGIKNRIGLLDQVDTIKDLRDARVKHGMTLDDANKKYVKDIEGLRRSAIEAGFAKGEVNKLIGAYKNVPGQVKTPVSAPGVDVSTKKVRDYNFSVRQIPGRASTNITVSGDGAALNKLERLLVAQDALKKGISVSAAASAFRKNAYAGGGWTGPGGTWDEAGVVHADEFVIRKNSRQKIEKKAPGLLDRMNTTGDVPVGYAAGGRVSWPYPVNAGVTRIPSKAEAMSAVTPAFGGGGPTLDFIIRAVHSRFPNMRLISGYRPGARTLSGNVSLHALRRAADWPASHDLAVWWNQHYKAQTKEFISPWNDLNIHNGARHAYGGAIYAQHSGANAHDHIGMANGGVINEPVFGIGASGRSYSFGERGTETVTPGGPGGGGGSRTYSITVNPTPLAHPRDIGREVVGAIQVYEQGSGNSWRTRENAS